jgi:periplasmic divalent cation tolerance protein
MQVTGSPGYRRLAAKLDRFDIWRWNRLMKLLAVVTTVGSLDDATAMARALVGRRLAACAQISEIRSFYSWEGALQDDREWRVLLKTTEAQYAAVELAIRELHRYDLPAIHAFALEHVYPAYAAWVEANSNADAIAS